MSTHDHKNAAKSYAERFNVLTVGTTMPDGTVYAGVSPSSGTVMFTTAEDWEPSLMFGDARDQNLTHGAHGHSDWRVPTYHELCLLFENRAAIGGFTGGRYWSSNKFGHSALMTKDFENPDTKTPGLISLRFVRG